jgi:hypothetical protein
MTGDEKSWLPGTYPESEKKNRKEATIPRRDFSPTGF